MKKLLFILLMGISSLSVAETYPASVEQLRSMIDQVDDELLVMINERMFYSQQINIAKRLEDAPVRDANRELFIISRIQAMPHPALTNDEIEEIWTHLMQLGRLK